ncbi:MAG: 16S rRNA (cytosine(967)-C(5))-methyltransferase [Mastigocoleus sp.]
MDDPRQLAFLALREVHRGAFADVALDRVLNKSDGVRDINRRLMTELVYGSIRRARTLDVLINQLATKKVDKQPKDLRTILHLGLYQLRFAEKIPESAAVNTTVQLAKDNGFRGLSGFVNGLLRQYVRLSKDGNEPLELPVLEFSETDIQINNQTNIQSNIQTLGILHSFPDWIIQVWVEQFGWEETEKLCEWMNQTPTIDLRVNPLRTNLESVKTALKSAGVLCQPLPGIPQALRLIGNTGSIQKLPGFHEGWWSVQDASAQIVGHFLDPQPGEIIIDACAAPGGKTTHIAELMGDTGKIYACDRTASRLRKLKDNARRLQLGSIEVLTGDSRNLQQFLGNVDQPYKADRVLIDVPCSGLGTLHRHADARWRQTPERVAELTSLQEELLTNVSEYVKPGGVLVYATCTLHPQENEEIIASFLTQNPNWQIEKPDFSYSLNTSSNKSLAQYYQQEGWMKIIPSIKNMDGFFVTRLRKAKD